jgi:hypothetical protein
VFVVFLVLLLTLAAFLKGMMDVTAIMMMSVVMATLCLDLMDEVQPMLLPFHESQN